MLGKGRGAAGSQEGFLVGKVSFGPQGEGQMLIFISFPPLPAVAQNLRCHKGTSVNIEDSPSTTFNWTTEKFETCDNGSLCQESVLMIKAGERRRGSCVGWEEG